MERRFWRSRFAFVMAAIGSAVGLGNVWRFPYICYTNGGGAFLIPYFVALVTAGIPLLILELSFGHWSQNPPSEAFRKINPRWEWIGWWTTLIPFVISIYYVVVMAWCFSYFIYSIDIRWSTNAAKFFLHDFLGVTGDPTIVGGIRIPVFLSLCVIWLLIFLILYKGVDRISKVVYITVPLPWVLLVILTIRGLTLPGAMDGVSYYLTPDFSQLLDVNVWLAAYAQIFFSLSLAQGIMITYASYLRKKSELSKNAVVIALGDAATSFLAGFAVFSIVGYLAIQQGLGIENLGISGPSLVFITYPTAIHLFPVASILFGMIFYISLLTFGIDSAFSMVEPMVAGVEKKWHISKTKTTAIICFLGFLLSILFTFEGGYYWLSVVDHFIANFGLVVIGLVECIILGWLFRIAFLREHANKVSDFRLGVWWDILIKFIVPGILLLVLLLAIVDNVLYPYEGYPLWVLCIGGVLPVVSIILGSYVLMVKKPFKKSK